MFRESAFAGQEGNVAVRMLKVFQYDKMETFFSSVVDMHNEGATRVENGTVMNFVKSE